MSGIEIMVDANDLWEEVEVNDGIVYWKEDGTTPPPELLRMWKEQGMDFNYDHSLIYWQMEQGVMVDWF